MQIIRTPIAGMLAAVLTAVLPASNARADLVLPGCSTVAILESAVGVMDCVVQNTGDEDVDITGSFGFSQPVGPDLSDHLTAVIPFGLQFPTIDAHDSHDFQYLLRTPQDLPEFPADFGVNILSVIFSGEDQDGDFVPGHFRGGIAFVLDDLSVPFGTSLTPPDVPISTVSEYDLAVQLFTAIARESGGTTFPVAEPGALGLIGVAGAALLLARRRRSGS